MYHAAAGESGVHLGKFSLCTHRVTRDR